MGEGFLLVLPQRVVGVEAAQREGELVQDAHREGAGADGGVENPNARDGADGGAALVLGERVVLEGVFVIEQPAQTGAGGAGIGGGGRNRARQRRRQRLVHHVIHHRARRVVRAGHLARRVPRFGRVGGEQVLERLAEQLRVERHFRLGRRVFLHRELVALEQRDKPVFIKEQAVGDAQFALMGEMVGEAVHAVAAASLPVEAVEAVEQPAVDERRPREHLGERVGVVHLVAVSALGEVAVRGVGFGAEPALGYLRVQRGEEQVLDDGAVVRIAARAVVIAQQRRDLLFDEQVFVDQPLLFDEPDEQQPRDEPDDVFFRLQRDGFARRESRFADGALKPREEVFVEILV